MDLLEGLYTRRSVRHFTDRPVEREDLTEIIRAATWAPSGLNNQPWRFVIIQSSEVRQTLASLTHSRKIIEQAPACIAVFIDKTAMYDETKDHQTMGACIQNMLLASHAMGLGAVWLGEILKNAEKVRLLLDVPQHMELMAVVAIGHPASRDQKFRRKELDEVIIKNI